jgi:hypothetical protein
MMNQQARREWVAQVKGNGWAAALSLTLDVLAPLGPLGAQVVWVLQPALRPWMPPTALEHLALTLERPDELAQVRCWLDEDDPADDELG